MELLQLYERNCGAAISTPGLSIVKLRYEHLYLLKMRVDLAAQVYVHVKLVLSVRL